MAATAKYSPLDHSGIEVVEQRQDDGPEVVPGSNVSIERVTTDLPEALQPTPPPDHYAHDYKHGPGTATAPGYSNETKPSYISPDAKRDYFNVDTSELDQHDRRYCGLRRPWFIAVIVIALFVIIIGAVLGGVLGTLLPKNRSSSTPYAFTNSPPTNTTNTTNPSDTPLQAMSKSGLATAVLADGSDTLLAYYMDPDGRIIENLYLNGTWSVPDSIKINDSVVSTEAAAGSPMAAISYTDTSGAIYRQVFYFDSTGTVKSTNATGTGSWSAPSAISTDASAPNTPALAACWDQTGLNGIRVYYGSVYGYVQEVGWDFTGQYAAVWTEWNTFAQSDTNSGVACAAYNDPTHQYMNVYFRNTSSGAVSQNYYDYNQTSNGWSSDGPTAWANQTILAGSDIAVCNDDTHTEYVFYQVQGGLVTRGVLQPDGTVYDEFTPMQGASVGTKLAAAYIDGGALFMFQNDTSGSTLWISDVSRSYVSIANGFVA